MRLYYAYFSGCIVGRILVCVLLDDLSCSLSAGIALTNCSYLSVPKIQCILCGRRQLPEVFCTDVGWPQLDECLCLGGTVGAEHSEGRVMWVVTNRRQYVVMPVASFLSWGQSHTHGRSQREPS